MQGFRYLDDTAILRLSEEKCIGCVKGKKALLIDADTCMECGACAKNCPTDAIYVNPDDGCGCAAYIIYSWIARFRGETPSGCGC